jgi:uncharacterized protein YjbJ (UPF0337 family)
LRLANPPILVYLIYLSVRILEPAIGQTPDRKPDKQRPAYRTEADIEGSRGSLSCILYEKTCPSRAKSERRNTVKSSTKDRAKGTYHELKGKAKEIAGKVTDNPKLKAEGTGEKIAGKVQEKIGRAKKVLGK